MSHLANLEKTAADHLDYDIDYGRWLPAGDIIVNAVATVDNTLATFVITNVEVADQVVRVWVDGGVDGEESDITILATTKGKREKEACFRLRIREH